MKPALKSNSELDLAVQLAQLFHHEGYRWIEADNQLKPSWQTKTDHPLSVGEVVLTYLDPQKLIGVGFGQTTKYLLLDLDTSSKYHPEFDIDQYQNILNALESLGLVRHMCLRSSHSNGRHVIFPLPSAVNTFQLAAAARVTLADRGFDLKNGQLETFPNTKQFASKPGEYSHYKLHRLPLQPNSGSWLMEDDGLSLQPMLDSTEAQLTAFLAQWSMAADGQDMALLNRKLPQLYETFKKRKRKYQAGTDEDKSAKAKKWEAVLDLNIQVGWTDFGQTYNLMPKFLAKGVVFLYLTGEALHKWMLSAITTAPGYRQYCRHQHQMNLLVWSWIKTNDRTQYYTPYRAEPDRSQPYPFGDRKANSRPQPNTANKKAASLALHRIKTTYACLRDRLTPELKIDELRQMIREQMKKIFDKACSNSTLNKHRNIWHPDHNEKNLTTLTQTEENPLETRPDLEISSEQHFSANERFETQTDIQRGSDHPQIPMICSAHVIEPNINTPTPPRASHHNVVDTYNTTNPPQTPGKFAVLAGALSKIIAVAAIVLNIGVNGGIVDAEPAIDETSSTSTPIQTTITATATATTTTTTTTTTAEQTELERDLNLPVDETALSPCQDPRISPMYLIQYNPNQIGVPWTNAAEFHKFLGYLVIVAKTDKTIKNPWAWAIKSIKNIKERGINSHWLTFTGQQMLDPNSPQMQQVRAIFPQTTPAPANVTIARPNESIANIVQQVNPQPPKTEPKIVIPPDPTPHATIRAYQPQQHTQDDPCPECELATPTAELEQWKMCRFCAQKILWRRLI